MRNCCGNMFLLNGLHDDKTNIKSSVIVSKLPLMGTDACDAFKVTSAFVVVRVASGCGLNKAGGSKEWELLHSTCCYARSETVKHITLHTRVKGLDRSTENITSKNQMRILFVLLKTRHSIPDVRMMTDHTKLHKNGIILYIHNAG